MMLLSTKLQQITTVLQSFKNSLPVSQAFMAANAVNIGYLFDLYGTGVNIINTIITPYAVDAPLASYVDQQLSTTFNLATKLNALKTLLQNVGADILAVTTPYVLADQYTYNTVFKNGVVISLPAYSPAATATIQADLVNLYNAIPAWS